MLLYFSIFSFDTTHTICSITVIAVNRRYLCEGERFVFGKVSIFSDCLVKLIVLVHLQRIDLALKPTCSITSVLIHKVYIPSCCWCF